MSTTEKSWTEIIFSIYTHHSSKIFPKLIVSLIWSQKLVSNEMYKPPLPSLMQTLPLIVIHEKTKLLIYSNWKLTERKLWGIKLTVPDRMARFLIWKKTKTKTAVTTEQPFPVPHQVIQTHTLLIGGGGVLMIFNFSGTFILNAWHLDASLGKVYIY